MRRIPTQLIVKHLAHIAVREAVKVEEAALYAIARGADGGMRDAESTLDQLISFCGEQILENDVLSMFGLSAREHINGLAHAIVKGQFAEGLKLLDDLARGGKDLGRLLSDLLGHFRNLLVYRVTQGDKSLLEISEFEASHLASESNEIDTQAVIRVLDVLTEAEGRLRDAASKKIFLEVSLLKAIQARNAVSIDSVMQKLRELRAETAPPESVPSEDSGTGSGASTISSPPQDREIRHPRSADPNKETPPASPRSPGPSSPVLERSGTPSNLQSAPSKARVPSLSDPVNAEYRGDLDVFWADLVEQVGKASPFVKTYLLEAHPVSLVKNVLTIGLDPEFEEHLALMDNSKTRTLLQTKLEEAGIARGQVKFILSERPAARRGAPTESAPPSSPSSAPESPQPAATARMSKASTPGSTSDKTLAPKPLSLGMEEFKSDPLIRQALEIFRGQIVDVRS